MLLFSGFVYSQNNSMVNQPVAVNTTFQSGWFSCIPPECAEEGIEPIFLEGPMYELFKKLLSQCEGETGNGDGDYWQTNCNHQYTAYDAGFGYTLEEALVNLDQATLYSQTDIIRYRCNQIGINTGCAWGSYGCIATMTYRCCDKVPGLLGP